MEGVEGKESESLQPQDMFQASFTAFQPLLRLHLTSHLWNGRFVSIPQGICQSTIQNMRHNLQSHENLSSERMALNELFINHYYYLFIYFLGFIMFVYFVSLVTRRSGVVFMGAPRNGDQAAATNRVPASDFGSQRTETEVPETSGSKNAPSGCGKRAS